MSSTLDRHRRPRYAGPGCSALLVAACAAPPPPDLEPREHFREGAGRTVVMLGGGIWGAAMFAPHARALSADHDVVRVQTLNVQAARAGTPLPRDWSVAAEAEALARTLAELGVTAPVDVVGASFGAVVALRFAVVHPERVRSLVLFEPPAFWVLTEGDVARDPTVRAMLELTRALTADAEPTDAQLLRFRSLLGHAPPAVPEPGDRGRAEWDLARRALRGLAAVPSHREDRVRLERLRVPVLLLAGSGTVPFHRRIVDRLAELLPHAERAELPGGHAAPRVAPDAFVAALRAFFAQTRSGVPGEPAARPDPAFQPSSSDRSRTGSGPSHQNGSPAAEPMRAP